MAETNVRCCPTCGNPLVQRPLERPSKFAARKYCGRQCKGAIVTPCQRPALREQARQMRREGATVTEIQKATHVASRTVCTWVADVCVPDDFKFRRSRVVETPDIVAPTTWLDAPTPRLRNLIEQATARELAVMRRLGVVGAALALLIAVPAIAQEHPPAGMPDPFMEMQDARGVSCCHGRDCAISEPCTLPDGSVGLMLRGICRIFDEQSLAKHCPPGVTVACAIGNTPRLACACMDGA